jgi:hypothetical protein
MQVFADDNRITPQDYEFYDLRVKRDNLLYFKFFLVWSMWVNVGRVHMQAQFALEFGIVLDSNLISRIMVDLQLQLAPKKRVQEVSFTFPEQVKNKHFLLQPVAQQNLDAFNQLEEETQTDLLDTLENLAAGDTLTEIQEKNPNLKPFKKLKQLGSKLSQWVVRAANSIDAVAIAMDEKVIKKAFDLTRNPKLSSHWVSRSNKYLPSLIVEVAALVRPGRLAEVVGHFFPYPQRHYDHRNKRKSMKKHIYLADFLEALYQKFGHLIFMADANYSTKKMISWFMNKGWDFVMRLNPNQVKLLEPLQKQFDADKELISLNEWFCNDEFGGWIRVLAFRRYWTDAKGKRKEKRYFIITNLDWDARKIWRFYRLRWTLENTFKCLPMLDRIPGLDPKLISGLFAMIFHVMAPICYQSRSSSRTIAKLLQLGGKIEAKKVSWQNIPTRFARKLLLIGYYRSMKLMEIRIIG